MSGRLSSGHANLDLLLGGGLPANAINMIIGAPGSGKTILAQQYQFHNAAPERPALYVTTVSEPLDKLVRYGQSLDFFDATRVGRDVLYEDLGAVLHDDGLEGTLKKVVDLLHTHHPGLLVIDSFKALGAFAADAQTFRRFLHDLAGHLTARAMSSFWIGEYERDDATHAPEFAVADAIISLGTLRTATREVRMLQVLKLRGSAFRSGEHAYRISSTGLRVFPRLADPRHRHPPDPPPDHLVGGQREPFQLDALAGLGHATERRQHERFERVRLDRPLAPQAQAALALGCAGVAPKHFRIIKRLGEYGFFRAGGILIGTHAFVAFGNLLGVRWIEGAATLDVDFDDEDSCPVGLRTLVTRWNLRELHRRS